MPSNYPGTLDVLTNPIPNDPLASVTVPHSAQHTNINDIIEAIQAKLGIGVSTPPGTGAVVGSNGAGGSLWRQIANGDIASAAAILVSKLAAGGTANRVVGTADGTTMALQQINGNMIASATLLDANFAANTISGSKIQDNSLSGGKIQSGTIGTAQIADGQLTLADLAASTCGRGVFAQDGAALTHPGGGWNYTGATVSLTGLTPGRSKILLIVTGSATTPTAGANINFGVGIDSTTAPTFTGGNQTPFAGYAAACVGLGAFTATLVSHNFYALWQTNVASMSRYSATELAAFMVND